jgi:hypothetical protein
MPKGRLLNLTWIADLVPPEARRKVPVALRHQNVLDTQKPRPAIVLFPAFLTPAVHVAGDTDGMFEVLLVSIAAPALTAADVNLHLKISIGLDPNKVVANGPLFANPKDKIIVKRVDPDGNGILATEKKFQGILDQRFRSGLPGNLDTFYAVRIHESCLSDPAVVAVSARAAAPEQQDKLLTAMLKRRNGPALHGQGGRGTHAFTVSGAGVDLASVDQAQPIRAYHPLFFYEAGAMAPASFAHVSDLHINVRQQVMQASPARVIDAASALVDSPPLGPMVNICGANLTSILGQAGGDQGVDVLMVGGDLIDHIQNVYPYPDGTDPGVLAGASAKAIWDLMDLRDKNGYATHYQAFVDYIAFYSMIGAFYRSHGKPAYGITGNHDCYEEAFGTSPRVFHKRANEGIPADLNLTFYEAILTFGETFDTVRRTTNPNYTPALLEWFYTVFTPFADYAVALPKQRIVGLAWGEDESIMRPKGQGLGHLPRANEAVTDAQLAIFQSGLGTDKRTALLTHFTFVSYADSLSILPEPRQGNILTSDSYGDNDLGTFEKNRRALYAGVADPARTQFVVTGHSHRKGLYFLGQPSGDGYATEMHGLRAPQSVPALNGAGPRTPIIVSDSSGPLPRLNLSLEFEGWGSDVPSGTRIQSAPDGSVSEVRAITSGAGVAKPRLAVALDYLHTLKDEVFDEIETWPFDPKKPRVGPHGLTFTFHKAFPTGIGLDSVVLYGKATVAADWVRIPLDVTITKAAGPYTASAAASAADAGAFYDWLTIMPKTGRFASLRFSAGDPALAPIYDAGSAWNIELDCRPSRTNLFHSKITYVVLAKAGSEWFGDSRPVVEGPSFDWRRRFAPYQ